MDLPGVDSHFHLVDFLQRPRDPADLLAAMDDAGLVRAVVFGLPVRKKWSMIEPVRPGYYLDDNAPCYYDTFTDQLVLETLSALDGDARSRIAPLLCGFDPTDLLAIDRLEFMALRSDAWRGIGELLLRHDELTNLTYGETARAGHPALDPVLDFAASHRWPVSVHHDVSSEGRPNRYEYVDELRGMLDRHPDTDVVWCHAGVSRSIKPEHHHRLVGELLEDYERLHVDLSWALYDLIFSGGEPDSGWVELVSQRPDRFVVGSDTVGDSAQPGPLVRRFDPLLAQLSGADARLVACENAERLWFSS